MTARAPGRVQFVPRTRLNGSDLRDAVEALSALRARHVRAMHATWGVAIGFVMELRDGGATVRVGPGLAYDACGAELLSPHTVDLRIPASARKSGARVIVRVAGSGAPDAAVRLVARSAPKRAGRDVPLAALRPGGALDLSARQCARTLAMPHLATGRVERAGAERAGFEGCWSVRIDASRAEFAGTPVYFATLGPLPDDRVGVVLGPIIALEIGAEDATGFTLTVRRHVPGGRAFADTGAGRSVASRPLPAPVDWVGVEPPPTLSLPPVAAPAQRPPALFADPRRECA